MSIIERPSLTPSQFSRFADIIYKISGIRFQESKAYFLASKLDLRQKSLGLTTVDGYYDYLIGQAPRSKEFDLLLNEVTINETFFYRNQSQIDIFNNQILKEVMENKRKKADRKIRIWSAASSTGDEAYTIAIDFLEKGFHKEFNLEIVGTDISHKALEIAKNGVYKKYSIRNIPTHILTKYFNVVDEYNYELKDEIKKYVTFKHCNLSDAIVCKSLNKFDITFCRNVLIYFDRESREKVLQNIYNNLNDDGYLLVGHSENLYAERHLFINCKDKLEALAYVKAPKGTEKAKF